MDLGNIVPEQCSRKKTTKKNLLKFFFHRDAKEKKKNFSTLKKHNLQLIALRKCIRSHEAEEATHPSPQSHQRIKMQKNKLLQKQFAQVHAANKKIKELENQLAEKNKLLENINQNKIDFKASHEQQIADLQKEHEKHIKAQTAEKNSADKIIKQQRNQLAEIDGLIQKMKQHEIDVEAAHKQQITDSNREMHIFHSLPARKLPTMWPNDKNSSTGQCSFCMREGDLICERCGTFYCCEKCQLTDWLSHKRVCLPIL